MSPSDLSELEQLDDLAAELADAGRLARIALANRARPEPAFALGLRVELVGSRPVARMVAEIDLARMTMAGSPVPPARPLDAPERRHGNRPFGGPDRRSYSPETEDTGLDIISVTAPDPLDASRVGGRRQSRDDADQRLSPDAPAALVPMLDGREAEEAGRVTALRPSMHWHIPTRVMPSRWIATGIAASVAVAALIYGSGFFAPAQSVATADVAVAATLVRGGASSPLAAGMELHQGDEIQVGANG